MKARKSLLTLVITSLTLITTFYATPSYAENKDVLASGMLIRPGNGGVVTETFCPPSMVAVGISVSTLTNQPFLQDLRLECLNTVMPEDTNDLITYSKIFASSDPRGSRIKTVYCPAGSVVTGLRMAAKVYINDVAPICTDPETEKTTLDSKIGAGQGLSLEAMSACPYVGIESRISYVIGVYGFGAGGVDALGTRCGRTLKQDVSFEIPTEQVLLGQYLPQGTYSSNSFLAPIATSPYVNLGYLTQVGGDGSSNSNVFPFIASTSYTLDFNHYFRFHVTPINENVTVRLTKITYDAITYPVGAGSVGNTISGESASQMAVRYVNNGAWQSIPVSRAVGKSTYEFTRSELSNFLTIKNPTEITIHFLGATGRQYNDLSARDGAQGLRVYGELIDNTPIKEPIDTTPKELKTPTNFVSTFANGKLKIILDLQEDVSAFDKYKVFLLAPDLGFSAAKKLEAEILDGQAIFNIGIPSSLSGKSIPIQLWAAVDSIESTHLLKTISIPKLEVPKKVAPTKKAPTKVAPTKKASTPTTVKCAKAGLSRTFTGKSCPPGWVKK